MPSEKPRVKSADLVIRGCSQLLTCRGPLPKRGKALENVGLIKDGCIASFEGEIVFIGSDDGFQEKFSLTEQGETLDATGLTALPGFVDPHTHLPFAGSREEEFALRLQGYTYQQLAQKGMGIQTSVRETRRASREELVLLCLHRLDSMLLHGTTTVEAKSGYGLNRKDEIKQLEAIRKADALHPVDVIPTFMGAHEVPPEYRSDKKAYIDLLIHSLLPEVKKRELAVFFDVFCEEGVYSVEESRRMIRAAKKLGYGIKIHADEFASLGGAQMAVEEGAASADHLLALSKEGIRALSRSRTASTLLPAVPFFLMQNQKAPARALIDSGAAVALATDFNPGSSMTESMLFVLQLAVFTLDMGIEESINAATANAAYALGLQDSIGSLEVGKKMDLILCDIPNYLFLAYHPGINPIRHVIKNGQVLVRNRQLASHLKSTA